MSTITNRTSETATLNATGEFLLEFAGFVTAYNAANGTNLSVESYTIIANPVKVKGKKAAKSTKALSYEQFQQENGSSVAHAIYKMMKAEGVPMSRVEIAQTLAIRLSTVCGQIHLMLEAGLVAVVGTKVDENSNRTVELIQAL